MSVGSTGRVVVAPSLLAADFGRLREEMASVTEAGADWLHFDIMDGHFVPNISFGPQVLAALRPHSRLPFDVHLMIAPVDPFAAAFAEAGADHILIHPEAGPHPHRTLQLIRSLGKKPGVVLNPGTPIESITWLLDLADVILVMSVNPGFGGQRFLASQLPKIAALRRMIDAAGRPIALAVDGGITPDTAAEVLSAGADTLIAGTSVFGAADRAAAIGALRGGARRPIPPAEDPRYVLVGDVPVGGAELADVPLSDVVVTNRSPDGGQHAGIEMTELPAGGLPIGEVRLSDIHARDAGEEEAVRGGRLRGGAG
jgi:ribulose-phosphate 3-epimerase